VGNFAHLRLHGGLATVLITAVVLAGCGNTPAGGGQTTGTLPPPFVSTLILPTVTATVEPSAQPTSTPTLQPTATVLIPGPLTTPDLSLRAGPVAVPLELRIPSLQMSAPVVGVGITAENIMDAPRGPVNDPLWNTVFWYRGGGIPGDSGTATFAGHVNDALGQPAIFARIGELVPGDPIIVYDTRSGHEVLFLVTETVLYSLLESADPDVLRQVYGAGPVTGTGPQPAADGLSHLTLITCSGDFINGSFDHRLVVYAVQSQ
jgi:sortase (surface protein transpeptidase)